MPLTPPPPREVIGSVHARCPGCWSYVAGTLRNVVLREPVTLTSWWRSDFDNERVGGQPTSQHLFGTALDIAGPGAADAAEQLQRMGWTRIREGDHEHLQVFTRNPFVVIA